VIEFNENKGKVRSIKVVVEGTASSERRIDLLFKRVIVERQVKGCLPKKKEDKTCLEVLYLDEDLNRTEVNEKLGKKQPIITI
jgi:hypothetical protein